MLSWISRRCFSGCSHHALLLVFCTILIAHPIKTRGAFINGVDHFIGTAYDTNTWYVFCAHPLPIQNNSLQFVYAPEFGDGRFYTASVTVGIGQFVRTDVTINSISTQGGVGSADIYLALNSGINVVADNGLLDPNSVNLDGHFAVAPGDISRFLAWGVTQNGNVTNGNGLPFQPSVAPALGQTYQLEIDRISASEVGYSLSDGEGQLLGTIDRSFTFLSPELQISIGSSNLNATFEDVSIGVVPEPESLLGVAMLGLCLFSRAAKRNLSLALGAGLLRRSESQLPPRCQP